MTHPLDDTYAAARALLVDYLGVPMLARGAFIAKLRPRSADFGVAFEPPFAAEQAEQGYRQLWGNAPVWPVPEQPLLEVFCATSDVLAAGSGDATSFPGGYHGIGAYLKKGVIWVAWSITSKGRGGNFFDGLVKVDADRWAWFPRPWKVLPRPPAPPLYWDD